MKGTKCSNISESQNNAKGKKPRTKFKIKYKLRSVFMECSKKETFWFIFPFQTGKWPPASKEYAVSTLWRSITLGNHDSAPIGRSSVFKDIHWQWEKLKSALNSFWYHLTLQPWTCITNWTQNQLSMNAKTSTARVTPQNYTFYWLDFLKKKKYKKTFVLRLRLGNRCIKQCSLFLKPGFQLLTQCGGKDVP